VNFYSLLGRIASSEKFKIGNRLSLRILQENEDARYELAIILDDDTRRVDWEESWIEISNIHRVLLNLQGANVQDFDTNIRLHIRAMNRIGGFSYTEIALWLNLITLYHLIYICKGLESSDDQSVIEHGNRLQSIWRALQMKADLMAVSFRSGFQNYKEGRIPWTLNNGPVSDRRVKDSIRDLEAQEKKRKHAINSYTEELQLFAEEGFQGIESIDFFGDVNEDNPVIGEIHSFLSEYKDSGGFNKLRKAIKRFQRREGG